MAVVSKRIHDPFGHPVYIYADNHDEVVQRVNQI